MSLFGGRSNPITIGYVRALIDANNKQYGTTFSVGGAYGYWELWADHPAGGGERIEVGTARDLYNAFVRVRFMEKYRRGVR